MPVQLVDQLSVPVDGHASYARPNCGQIRSSFDGKYASAPGSWSQHRAFLDQQGTIPIRPDVVHLVGGRPAAVFDAKYKLEGSIGRFTNPEAYQMLAYCTALDVPVGWLVYAHGIGASTPRRVCHTSIEIRHYPLDLAASPADLLSQLAAFAETAAEGIDLLVIIEHSRSFSTNSAALAYQIRTPIDAWTRPATAAQPPGVIAA